MPLLDIVGVSCFNSSFYSGFAFLDREDEENYTWALNVFKDIIGHENHPLVIMTDRELALMNAISNVFPSTTNLLCVWHIEKNVVANCKKYFVHAEDFDLFMLSWKNVVYSTTEAIFLNNWAEFEFTYTNKKDAIEYIRNIWLSWKEKFVSPWTEIFLHFHNRASSRAEGAHSKLKMYLQNSTGGFQMVKEKICLAVEHEFNELKVKVASQKIQVPKYCNNPVYRDLLYRVSQFALKEISNQYEKMKKGTMNPCTGHLMATMGLPCAHKMKESKENVISLKLIHPQWRIDTFPLNLEDDRHTEDNEIKAFRNLLDELYLKYQEWPRNKKEVASSMITKLVNQSDTYFEPIIQKLKGRPPKSKKKKGKGITSTARDPSRFEYVESSRSQNPSSSTCIFQGSNNVSIIHHKNNIIDLNVYPDLSSDIF
ncbi:PKS-NRPS hybrid synthetase cheA-like [Rutidosis leptorrhynchoides]|uniref:PKS-NRPS hybrid synthetase cheA-like n=1 Tax=Rutidosis leptorrhynchoides TaxID=125765 RepID=UPI003A992219